MMSKMIRLQTLILENIESKYLQNLLNDLASLPYLFSLVIIPIDDVEHKNNLYRMIFHLPVLKYCKVTFNGRCPSEPLKMANNSELSPIKNLTINSSCCINELIALLSYVPQLRRLLCYNLSHSSNIQIQEQSIVVNNLTHIFLKIKDIPWNQLKFLIKNYFCQLQMFHISTNYHSTYSDTNLWEQLILSYMPNLRIFHIDLLPNYELNHFLYCLSNDQYISLSWFERQWCFNRQYERIDRFHVPFYSIQSYRRKHYKSQNWSRQEICPIQNKNCFYSVDHIHIRDYVKTKNNSIYFPNVTKLTLFEYSNQSLESISTILDRIIPLTQLTTLIITYRNFCIGKLVELLYYSPNIDTISIKSLSFFKISDTSIQESQTFAIVSKRNKIINMTIENNCIFENIALLSNLCPRLQHLTISICPYNDYFQSIVKFLLSNNNENTHNLFSLCFTYADELLWGEIISLNLFNDVSMELVARKLYLWW